MSQVPKCASWRGHKFEARYSYGPSQSPGGKFENASSAFILEYVKQYRTETYHHDICVRCGFVVERKTPKTTTKSTA